MRRSRIAHCPLVLLGLTISIACSGPRSEGPARRTVVDNAGTEAVSAALDESVVAWNRGDLDAHVAIYADSGTGGPPIAFGGRARARASLARYFSASRPRLAIDSLHVRALGSDYVLATGRWTLVPAVEEPSGWFTEIWTRTAASWKIVHEHTQ